MKSIGTLILILFASSSYAQEHDKSKFSPEKDRVFIDWNDQLNSKYPDKESVKKLSNRSLKNFYNQNLEAKRNLENDGEIQSKGSFTSDNYGENYLIFSVKKGSLIYQEKVCIYLSSKQKLLKSK